MKKYSVKKQLLMENKDEMQQKALIAKINGKMANNNIGKGIFFTGGMTIVSSIVSPVVGALTYASSILTDFTKFRENNPALVVNEVNKNLQVFNKDFGTNLAVSTSKPISETYTYLNNEGKASKQTIIDSAVSDASQQLSDIIGSKTSLVQADGINDLNTFGNIGQVVIEPGSEAMVLKANQLILSLPQSVQDMWFSVAPLNEIREIACNQGLTSVFVSAGCILSVPVIFTIYNIVKTTKCKKFVKEYEKKYGKLDFDDSFIL